MNARIDLQQQFYGMLMESQFWSAARFEDYQRGQLTSLLQHARANVPFYERRLDAVWKPDGEIDWARWGDLPILKRRDLIEHRAAMQARSIPAGHGPVATSQSSGSTGVAITVTVNALAGLAYDCLRWRVQSWNQLDWSKRLLNRMGDNQGPENWPEGTPIGPWGPPWLDEARRGFAWSLNSKVPSDILLDIIADKDCAYLVTGPKVAHILALEAERHHRHVRLEAMLSMSGALSEDDRALCRRALGARIIDHYGSKEGGQIAHECAHGSLHLNIEAALVEIIDDQGQPCPPGIAGRIVMTPFFYTAQPLIRYEQGDVVIPGEPCACGSTLPTLKAILGRTLAVFRHPDGRAVVQIMPNEARDILQCEFWQMAQVGPNDYEIRYVPRHWEAQGDEPGFAAKFRGLYFDDAQVMFKRVREIPLTPAGKMLEYVNEFHAAASAGADRQ